MKKTGGKVEGGVGDKMEVIEEAVGTILKVYIGDVLKIVQKVRKEGGDGKWKEACEAIRDQISEEFFEFIGK